jgi:hypothetical protein
VDQDSLTLHEYLLNQAVAPEFEHVVMLLDVVEQVDEHKGCDKRVDAVRDDLLARVVATEVALNRAEQSVVVRIPEVLFKLFEYVDFDLEHERGPAEAVDENFIDCCLFFKQLRFVNAK